MNAAVLSCCFRHTGVQRYFMIKYGEAAKYSKA